MVSRAPLGMGVRLSVEHNRETQGAAVRAKFIIEVPATSTTTFLTNAELESRLRLVGLGMAGAAADYDDRLAEYKKAAEREWTHLPEKVIDEEEHLIFYSRLPEQSRLIITRFDEGYVVYRVINEDMSRLLKGTERLVNQVRAKAGSLRSDEILNDEIEVYEKGEDHVILKGRVIRSASREAIRRDPQSWITAGVTLLTFICAIAALAYLSIPDAIWKGSLERFSTAMIATFFVSLATVMRLFFQIRRKGGIIWTATSVEINR
jgi:hypothetical protein